MFINKLSQSNGKLMFNIFRQDILTMYENCELIIELIQYEGEKNYKHENNCSPPKFLNFLKYIHNFFIFNTIKMLENIF
jgi:hypothetical protein